ncbi:MULTISPECIES: SDR family oxidoreductase [unclassified Chelatococcus]|uniref:SDR family NAD(P)-dependent oxidoreductase n=1 Tax=unclassified Chelatococcus TaxID=2638111 RepID=UPI001BCC8F06|nr:MULTISPECIES: SDR family oxidoreductase [unclassified Chelatococcus]MBS7700158.1 SDR family oxidoreductase [Chelatococcus sp. YT9]MBX3556851.1 SDR family oxidoreductase [Chelatococcus sp.]
MFQLKDKVALITGGSSGIGRETALAFARQGAKVIITGRRFEPLERTAALDANIVAFVADVAAPSDAARSVAKVIETWGRLDILVNNAGAGAIAPLSDVTAEQIQAIFAVNVFGPSLLAREALAYLSGTQGTIINISSTFGHKAGGGLSHYAASKAALEHLTRCWALELASLGIRVNAVAAGPTESGALTGMMGLSAEEAARIAEGEQKQIPLKRRGVPEDVARWILNLADPASSWITGQVISVDGGLSLT